MPKLSELSKQDLKEVTQTMARAIYMAFDGYKPDSPDTAEVAKKDRHAAIHMRVFRALYDSNTIKEEEFFGSGLNEGRRGVISEFKTYYDEALGISKFYEETIKPVEEMAPHFAMPSRALHRMWCVAHYWKALCKEGGPFANINVENDTAVHDEDGSEEEEEGEEEESEEEGEAGSASEEEDSEDSEEGEEGESDEEEEAAESSEEEGEEEEEEPDPAEETAEEYAERSKNKNPMPPDFGLKGFDAKCAKYMAKETERINKEYERAKKKQRSRKD